MTLLDGDFPDAVLAGTVVVGVVRRLEHPFTELHLTTADRCSEREINQRSEQTVVRMSSDQNIQRSKQSVIGIASEPVRHPHAMHGTIVI